MILIRRSDERGNSRLDWLNSYHTFSFANYYDSKFIGFGDLRVINEDTVQPGFGFGKHAHDNMEIISYVVEGALEHTDSMGNGSTIKPGQIQCMSAGKGILHSEFNPSKTDLLHFLQIWIIPESKNLKPSYEQKNIVKSFNQFILIGSAEKQVNAVIIHQKIKLFVVYLTEGHSIEYYFDHGHRGWIQLIKGKIGLNGKYLLAGDGCGMMDENKIEIKCTEDSDLLMFDLG